MVERTIIRSGFLGQIPGLVFGMSTRLGGVSEQPFGMNVSFRVGDAEGNVQKNRELFLDQLGIRGEDLALPLQIHSNFVQVISSAGTYPECDGLVSTIPGLFVGVTVADCVPVILVDPVTKVVAAVHAGWRGADAGIAEVAIAIMMHECGVKPGNIIAYLGPSAGVCCYEVGSDVASRFPGDTVASKNGQTFLDVRKANRLQLIASGVDPKRIEESELCTISEGTLLHSFRREGKNSGRMMSVVGFRG